MKNLTEITRNLAMVTQLGLSLVTPLFVSLGLCWWLCSRFGLGGWIFLPGFFFGLGGSGTVFYKLYLSEIRRGKKEEKEKPPHISFNQHM